LKKTKKIFSNFKTVSRAFYTFPAGIPSVWKNLRGQAETAQLIITKRKAIVKTVLKDSEEVRLFTIPGEYFTNIKRFPQ
jgi:hypothetical protein